MEAGGGSNDGSNGDANFNAHSRRCKGRGLPGRTQVLHLEGSRRKPLGATPIDQYTPISRG